MIKLEWEKIEGLEWKEWQSQTIFQGILNLYFCIVKDKDGYYNMRLANDYEHPVFEGGYVSLQAAKGACRSLLSKMRKDLA